MNDNTNNEHFCNPRLAASDEFLSFYDTNDACLIKDPFINQLERLTCELNCYFWAAMIDYVINNILSKNSSSYYVVHFVCKHSFGVTSI